MTNPTNTNKINTGTRLAAMLLDHFFMTMIALVFFIPGIVSDFSDAFKVSHEPASAEFLGGSWAYIGLIGFACYFCKDIIKGRSIAKRILKLQLVDNVTGEVAGPMKCFIRNLLIIIWPIEVIIALKNTSRRLGDRIAGTKLVPFDPSLEKPGFNIGKALLPLALAYAMLLLFMELMPKPAVPVKNHIETSYNPSASKELEKILTDSLGEYFTPDIRIYDSVKNSKLKYVSVILRLKKNYIEDDNNYNKLHRSTTNLVYSILPKETFTGRLQYIYQAAGQFNGRSTEFGTVMR